MTYLRQMAGNGRWRTANTYVDERLRELIIRMVLPSVQNRPDIMEVVGQITAVVTEREKRLASR